MFLPKCNYVIKKFIFEYLKPKYQGKCQMFMAQNEEKQHALKVIKTTLDQGEFRLQQIENEIKKVDEKRGFLNILMKISESKTPIVFHSGLLDLILTMRQFFLPEMPPTLEEFKSITLSIFPYIFGNRL